MGWKQKQTIIKAAGTKQNLCLNKFNLYDNGISCVARYFPVSYFCDDDNVGDVGK